MDSYATTISSIHEGGRTAPLSFAQQRQWLLHQLSPDTSAFHLRAAYRVDGPLRVAVFERALNEIVRRHETLRTTFGLAEGVPVQRIAPALTLSVPVVDLRAVPDDEREARLARLVDEGVRQRFDPGQGPLLRVTLFHLAEERHALLIVFHHIISDGWSMGVFLRELLALYEAFAAGQPSPLAPLPMQYADFARWQQQALTDAVLKPQLDFWVDHLRGAPPVLELPSDRPRPPVQSFNGARRSAALPDDLAAALRAWSRKEGGTLFMTLFAAFAALLYRYTGQDDLVVGTPIANRNRVEIEGLIGFFVNTLALRVRLGENPTFRALFSQVREAALGAYDHQDLPFERLLEVLKPPRDLSRTPLFQVMFILQNAPMPVMRRAGLVFRTFDIEAESAAFDLRFNVRVEEGRLWSLVRYNTDLFDAATIDRFLGHYERLLRALVADPDVPVADLPLLAEDEAALVLGQWNDTAAPYPAACIHTLFEEQVERTPAAMAVVADGTSLTFAELNARANRLAHHLIRQGVTPGTPVGVFMERSADMVVGLLGILKAGGAYLPLDPAYPLARLAFMLQDSRAPVLVTQRALYEEGLAEALRERPPAVVYLETIPQADDEAGNPAVSVAPGDPAYVIYTSGSTGRPKGVLGLHRGAVNRFHWMWTTYPFEAGEVCAQKTALSFVDAVWEVFGPLLQGVPLVILRDEVVQDPVRLTGALATHGVTRLVLVPSLLRALLDAGEALQQRLPRLRFWISSGEALPSALVERFYEQCPESRLLNLYGSSEVSADVLFYDTRGHRPGEAVPIGRPLANTQAYVLDGRMRPVPVGVPGELYVGGDGLAAGYIHRPEQTAARFVPDPFGAAPDARLYRTGDRARYRPDGALEFRGRLDGQVKLRGYRIETGEVEAVLRRHAAVREVVVMIREEEAAGPMLVAYVALRTNDAGEVGGLRAYLRAELPAYMVPAAFVFLDAFPLTPNGKVDRLALPAPAPTRAEPAHTYVAPRNELERRLTRLWEAVLGVRPIGVHDNFFDLGGHSLLAATLFNRMRETMGRELPLITLFQAPTVAQLAAVLAAENTAPAWRSLVPIQPGGTQPPLFCIPPAGTTSINFAALVRYLGPDQPVYGLEAVGMDGKEPPHTRVEEMARHYLKEVRALQPEGPYYLVGRCFGGVVAFEMGQQLHAQGQAVGLLAMLDTGAPGPRSRLPEPDLDGLHNLPDRPLKRSRVARVARKARWVLKKLRRGLNIVRIRLFGSSVERRHREVLDIHKRAKRRYVARLYPGRIVFFRPRTQGDTVVLMPARWANFAAGGVDFQEVPGTHSTMLQEPHVREVAERLKAALEATRNGLATASGDGAAPAPAEYAS